MAKKRFAGVSDQRKASVHRWEDALALFRAGRWRGAMYLAGYAVECRLKWKLMQRWNCSTLDQLEAKLLKKHVPQSPYTHSLRRLVKWMGVEQQMQDNKPVWQLFAGSVNLWQPAWRYSSDLASREDADALLKAVQAVVHWVDHNL